MTTTTVGVRAGDPRAHVVLSSGAGTVLIPRLLDRTRDSARVALVPGGAMVLGGDDLSVRVDVGPGCRLELVEVGGTVCYDAAGVASTWSVDIALDRGATLLWHGRETVVADGSNLSRSLHIELGAGARALIRETTVLGRSGEHGGRVRQSTTALQIGGSPILVEELDLDGHAAVPGVLGDNRVLDTVLLLGRRPQHRCGPGEMSLAEPGALARFLGSATHLSPLGATWDRWRNTLAESPPPEATDRAEDGATAQKQGATAQEQGATAPKQEEYRR